MAETTVVNLTGHEPRENRPLGNGFMVFVGVLTLALGGAVLAGLVPGMPAPTSAGWVSGLAIGGLLFVGLLLTGIGTHAALAGYRFRRRRRAHPHEPWLADHPWAPHGHREHALPIVLKSLAVSIPGFLLIGFAQSPMFAAIDVTRPQWMSAIGWAVTLLGVLCLFRGVRAVSRVAKYGAGWVRFDRFPFFLGETLDVRVGCGVPLDRFEKVKVTLRFIRVRYVESRLDEWGAVAEQHWAEAVSFEGADLQRGAVAISIPLPTSGKLETALSGHPPRYWELELRGTGRRPQLVSHLLVPIYARND